MNRIVFAMIAAIALSGFTTRDSASANTPPAFSADDESAVRSLVNEFANTWNRHDMKAMHELDTEDVEWINVVGHPIDHAHGCDRRCDHAFCTGPGHSLSVVGCGEDKSFIYDGQARWHLEDCALPEHGDRP